MILLTPGPTPVPERVREAMARPMIHHRTAEFEALYAECSRGLQEVFRTKAPVVTLAGSGSAAFEAAQLSMLRAGDRVASLACGRFGERWQGTYDRWAQRFDLRHVKVNAEWGEANMEGDVERALAGCADAAAVTLVQCETSTTAVNDVRGLAAVVRKVAPQAIVIVDAISSLGAIPLETDAWGVDVVVTGSQKALMMSPGLSFVSVSGRAQERLREVSAEECAAPAYLDLRGYLKGHAKGAPPFTPAVSLWFGLREALSMILEQGVERVWAETSRRARAARAGGAALGMRPATSAPGDSVTGLVYPKAGPEGVGDDVVRECARMGVRFAPGQDQWRGRMLRFSHMGAVTDADTLAGVEALARALEARGAARVSAGEAVEAVEAAREALGRRSGSAAEA